MVFMKDNIHDLHSLDKAIAELENKKTLLEAKLQTNGNHLQKNFMSMAYRSIVPKSTFETGPMAAAGNFLKGEKLKEGFTKLVGSLTEKNGFTKLAGSFTDMANESIHLFIN